MYKRLPGPWSCAGARIWTTSPLRNAVFVWRCATMLTDKNMYRHHHVSLEYIILLLEQAYESRLPNGMASALLSPDSPVLPNVAAMFNLMSVITGLVSLVRPRTLLDMLEFKLPVAAQYQKFAVALLRLRSLRDLFMGTSSLAVWYSGNRKLYGIIVLLGSAVALGDGFVQKQHLGRGEWKHWASCP